MIGLIIGSVEKISGTVSNASQLRQECPQNRAINLLQPLILPIFFNEDDSSCFHKA